MRWRRLANRSFVGTYALVALTGVIVARKLGAHDRGVYSIVTTVALLYAASPSTTPKRAAASRKAPTGTWRPTAGRSRAPNT